MKKTIVIWLGLLLSSFASFAITQKINLLEALHLHKVKFIVTRTDQAYNQKGLTLTVTNTSKEPLLITVDPAILFKPNDTNYQDLVLQGDEKLYVGAGRSNHIDVQTFCAKSYASSPDKDMHYTFSKQCDSNMIKTFAFIRKNYVDADLAQQAVWLLTDKSNDLSSVFDYSNQQLSQQLVTFLANLLHLKVPHYYVERGINYTPHQVAMGTKILKLHVTLRWEQDDDAKLSLAIFDSANKKIEGYFDNRLVRAGISEINASFETSALPEGNYKVRLYNPISGVVVKEVEVPLK